jgi:predicted transcriptional regulator
MRDVTIMRLQPQDARSLSDGVQVLKALLLECNDYYPDIERWYSRSILPGIADQSRVACVGMIDARPVAAAIVKRGPSAKFCHLRLSTDIQEQRFGDMFFSLMAADVRAYAHTVHFTLPSSLWETRRCFFESFGFIDATVCQRQYRRGDEELYCCAPISRVWKSTLAKLPGLLDIFRSGSSDLLSSLVLSIKPRFARAILDRHKTVEIRRRFSERWTGSRVAIYASHPVSGLLGTARVKSVVKAHPATIWDRFGRYMGCSQSEYQGYVASADHVYALVLEDAKEFRNVIPIETLAGLSESELHPPQSYLIAKDQDRGWGRAVTIASAIGSLSPKPRT